MVQTYIASGKKVNLREKKLSDAREDYAWQKDPELSRLDAVQPLTINRSQYLLAYETELRYPSDTRRQFAIDADGKHIGNCVYYDIQREKGEAELGIMLGNRDYWGKGYGSDAVSALVEYIFRRLNFRRIYLKTLTTNVRAQRCFAKCGFVAYGNIRRDGYSFMLMELTRKQWEKTQKISREPGETQY